MRVLLIAFYLGICVGRHGNNGSSDHSSGHACCVRPQFITPYVTAFHHTLTSNGGCNSNQTTPLSHKEVHVIRFGGSSHHGQARGRRSTPNNHHSNRHTTRAAVPVVLKIEPHFSSGVYDGPVVLVLWSKNPVKWTIDLERIGNTSRYKFMLPKHSRIMSSKTLSLHTRVQKFDDLPSTLEGLAQWTQAKLGAVTSVSNLPKSKTLILKVGIDSNAPSLCQLGSESASTQGEPPARAVTWQRVNTSACAARWNEGYQGSDLHIIEVKDTPQPPAPGDQNKLIHLEIKTKTLPILAQKITLVLKVPTDARWKINVSKFRGEIDIVTNSEVETADWLHQTVQTTFDQLYGTGQSLVDWVAESYGHPVSFTEAQVADKFMLYVDGGEYLTLLIPSMGTSCPTTWPDIGRVLQESHRLVCSATGLTVTLPRQILKDLDVRRADLSLLDASCRATENNTHYILSTEYNACGTQQHSRDSYLNKIILRTLPSSYKPWHLGPGVTDPDQMEGSGSGFGPGANSVDTFLDDEDLNISHGSVSVDLSCEPPILRGPGTLKQNPQVLTHLATNQVSVRLELFTDPNFSRKLDGRITDGATVYVQAYVNSQDPSLRVMIKMCDVKTPMTDPTNTLDKMQLFNDGCKVRPSVKILNDGTTNHEKRFSFEVDNYWIDGSWPQLTCELVICTEPDDLYSNIPQCMTQGSFCLKSNVVGMKDPVEQAKPRILRSDPFAIMKPHSNITHPASILPEETAVHQPPGSATTSSAKNSPQAGTNEEPTSCQRVVRVEGLDYGTVVGIAFAAFTIGVLLTGALWYIHTHTGPSSRRNHRPRSAETSGESTPSSTAPITIHQIRHFSPPLHHCAVFPIARDRPPDWRHPPAPPSLISQLIIAPVICGISK